MSTRETEAEKAGWTPGPWFASQNDFYWTVECNAEPFKYQAVADLVNSKCIVSTDGKEYDHGEANARLIAAAPELFDVLAPFIEIWAKGGEDYAERMKSYWGYDNLSKARAALWKATGAQS